MCRLRHIHNLLNGHVIVNYDGEKSEKKCRNLKCENLRDSAMHF